MAKVLGLDASSSVTGWAVVSDGGELIDFGEIRLLDYKKAKNKPLDSILYLFNELVKIVNLHSPDSIYIEAPHARFINAYKALCRIRGVCELAIAYCGHGRMMEVEPSHARLEVMGFGALEKEQICSILELHYKIDIATKGNDASDAIVVALCGLIESHEKELQCLLKPNAELLTPKNFAKRSKSPKKQTKQPAKNTSDASKKSKRSKTK